MYRVVDNRGTGKTSRLLLLAKENNGVIVCANPSRLREKALMYGIVGIEIISYSDYMGGSYDINKPVLIDDIEGFLMYYEPSLIGYTLTIE